MSQSGLKFNLVSGPKGGVALNELIGREKLFDEEEQKLNIELQEFIKNLIP